MNISLSDAAIVLLSSRQLSDAKKDERLKILPDLYHALEASIIFSDQLREDIIYLLPLMDDEQVKQCVQAVKEEPEVLKKIYSNAKESGDESFFNDLQSYCASAKRGLRDTKEILEQAEDEQERLEEMEDIFDKDV